MTGALARNEAGRMRVGGLDVEIRVEGHEGDPARLRRCLDPLQDYCIITESVQDGHGMLPLLAHSRVEFLKVKAVNLAAGLAAGAVLVQAGR